MTAYAVFVTFVLGVLCGVIATCIIGDQLDQRDMRRAKQAAASKDSDDMDDAVALVSDKLGATVLSVEETEH